MKYNIVLTFIVGFLFGIIVGVLGYATQTMENKYLNRVFVKSIDNNISTKELYFKLFPTEYKNKYTDWAHFVK